MRVPLARNKRSSDFNITPEERQEILRRFGQNHGVIRKALGVGQETLLSLLDPNGRVIESTVRRVRATLQKKADVA